jgi:hypothetical protein
MILTPRTGYKATVVRMINRKSTFNDPKARSYSPVTIDSSTFCSFFIFDNNFAKSILTVYIKTP